MQQQGHYSSSLLLVRHKLIALITTLLMVLIIWSSMSRGITLIKALQFEHPAFDHPEDLANITFVTQDWYTEGPNASYTDSTIWLTPAFGINASQDSSNLGRIVYKDPIVFFSNNAFMSFNTSFTFQIITTRPDGECGSGMAFFISQNPQAPTNSNNQGAIGLLNPDNPSLAEAANRFFAVEFDTRLSRNNKDPSYSHIGIDINSVISSNTTDTTKGSPFYPDLYLYSNFTFIAWIEYDASSTLIQVWMTNINTTTSHERPPSPCLQLHYDLSTLFLQRHVYFGFSATSAPKTQGLEGHAIYSWNFSNEKPLMPTRSNTSSNNNLHAAALGAAVGGGLALIALCAGVYMWIVKRHKRNATYRPSSDNNNIQDALRAVQRYSYRELKRATQDFSEKNKVGEGGFSIVYRGTLADGCVVAVKKLKQSVRMEVEFCAEMGIISQIRHRYLLELQMMRKYHTSNRLAYLYAFVVMSDMKKLGLQGWCYENGEALLVYKFIANGSLDGFLFGQKKGTLGSEARFRILEGVAAALEYLHGGLGDCVLHRDVKAANVLLTEELQPKLSDFGLARLIRHDEIVSMTVAGTPGYVAPEVVYSARATEKADVYSFGVLALEVACGRRASMDDSSLHPVDWVWQLHDADNDQSNINGLIDALDPSILNDIAADCNQDDDQDVQALIMQVRLQWRCVLHVALLCCHPSPESRPSMRQVTQTLHDRVLLPLPTTRPAYPYAITTNISLSTQRSDHHHHRLHQHRRSALVDPLASSATSTSSAVTSSMSSTAMQVTASPLSTTTTICSPNSEPVSPR